MKWHIPAVARRLGRPVVLFVVQTALSAAVASGLLGEACRGELQALLPALFGL